VGIDTRMQNLTVYHVNPASAGEVPVNMNTGDAAGDLFFYLGQFLLPLEYASFGQPLRRREKRPPFVCRCADVGFRSEFDCGNLERVGKNLVVTKVCGRR
jgi:hypothetical protein